MSSERYNIENLLRAVKSPELFVNEITRNIYKMAFYLHKRRNKGEMVKELGSEVNVMDEDWDHLIILDACRYDIFKELCDIENYEELTSINSVGSHSQEFVEKTFAQNQFLDTVCVTANGFAAQSASDSFHKFIFTEIDESRNGHPYFEGIAPDTVAQAAIEANEDYQNKRLIVHFMQPHNPYFGDRAEELRQELRQKGIVITQNKQKYDQNDSSDDRNELPTLMHAAREGYISSSEMKEIYRENIEIVLEHVKLLIDELEGKIVITADHGELLGENPGLAKYASKTRITPSGGFVGHAQEMYVKELRQVPWMVIRRGSRPNIVAENKESTNTISEDAIEGRLQALGYKD